MGRMTGECHQLWECLAHLVESIEDEPWLVIGNFNTVADLSEVCGNCGDIRLAMEEFQDCISQTGLITLPMQGDLYTWHNRSTGDQSLWKRLDRMLVNDRWLDRWRRHAMTVCTHAPRTMLHWSLGEIFVVPSFGYLGLTITWHLQRSSSLLSNEFGDTQFSGSHVFRYSQVESA
ncbi:UNVERIFIED_CONTAM: hypothetical protein Sradi_2108200 [Sesamum radiatum]|uniref:Endonuclease/exonuclease/phosphatase domain-containing protein n=1 Tax=Sesamum radiatum TaxID=300843 RepID=A0AAW2TJS6_SESRA